MSEATTYPQPHKKSAQENQALASDGAGNGIRTRDFNLGKVALYL